MVVRFFVVSSYVEIIKYLSFDAKHRPLNVQKAVEKTGRKHRYNLSKIDDLCFEFC